MSRGHEEGQAPRKAQQSSGSSTTNLVRLSSAATLGKFATEIRGVIPATARRAMAWHPPGSGPGNANFREGNSNRVVSLVNRPEPDRTPNTHPIT